LLAGFAEPISSTLKMEAIYSSETSVVTQRTTWRHIPEDDTLHNHRCENLKSYNFTLFLPLHSVNTNSEFSPVHVSFAKMDFD
jgi:hypothetical protein